MRGSGCDIMTARVSSSRACLSRMRSLEDCPDYRFSDSYRQTLCRLSHTFLRLSTLDPRLPQEGGKFQIRLAGPSWSGLGWLGAQEFRLEGVPTAPSEVSQGTHRRQTAVRVTRAQGWIRRDLQGEKFSKTMELLLEPGGRLFTRAHAARTAIRWSGGDSANPTGTIRVLGNKFRTLPETWIERCHIAGDRTWDLQVAALVL